MALKNYKVEQADGESTHYQIDDSDEAGKGILQALKDAQKDPNNPVKSVEPGEPVPFNKASSK